jgi:hypothetical protein
MDISQGSIVILENLTLQNGFSDLNYNQTRAISAAACLGVREGSNATIDGVHFYRCISEVPNFAHDDSMVSSAGIFLDLSTAAISHSIFSYCSAGSASGTLPLPSSCAA